LLQGLRCLLRRTDKETFKNENKRACEKHGNASIETFGNRGTHPRIQLRIRFWTLKLTIIKDSSQR